MDEFADVCPFPSPKHVAMGRPGDGYPLPWSVQTWLPGEVPSPNGLAASTTFAKDVAKLVGALRAAPTRGRTFLRAGRGGELSDSDEWMEICFDESETLLDVPRLRAFWTRVRELPRTQPDAMTHGDLVPANLLVRGNRLVGVIDAGGFGPADPALDLIVAWHLFEHDARTVFRTEVAADVTEWHRGAAWAFQQAMGLVWYYRTSNPGMAFLGRSTISRILADPELSGALPRPVNPRTTRQAASGQAS
jgi:aminoglycoside phosphotransferase (APT) family kinase protein